MPPLPEFPAAHPVLHTPAVWVPGCRRIGPVVALFRSPPVHLPAAGSAVVWVTASQRFTLTVNGTVVRRGPSRSDPDRWNVAPVDLRAFGPGPVRLAVRVWHWGSLSAKAQLGGPAFLLVAPEAPELAAALATGRASWRATEDRSLSPCVEVEGTRRGHLDVGTGETFDAALHPTGWSLPDYPDSQWPLAEVVCEQSDNPWGNRPLDHHLRPDPLPPLREEPAGWSRIAAAHPGEPPPDWAGGSGTWQIPADTTARVVLDRGELTNAYPRIAWEGGGGACM